MNRAFLERCREVEEALEKSSGSGRGFSGSAETPTKEGELAQDPEARAAMERERVIAQQEAERQFFDSYRTLGRLQTFVWINTKGFQKIMKKYDKRQLLRGTGEELGPDFEKRLEKEAFCSGKLEVLMELFKARRPTAASRPGGRPAIQLIAGNGNPALAEEISARLGVPLTPATISRFADGEVSIQIMENVRNSDVYIIQPTCPPVNDNLMELLLCASAVRRASAARVTAVVPYYGYARQDRKERSRVPISAADVAKMMEAMGIDRVCCVDLHCGQIQGFFGPRTPVDNLFAGPIAVSYFATRNLQNCVVVSPDAGGVARAKMFKEGLEASGVVCGLAMIIKQRVKAGEVGTTDLVGSVTGGDCIIIDDMIDTAGTLCAAANELITFGAKRVFAFATHGLLNGPAAERIEACALEEVVIANTLPLPPNVQKTTRKVRQLSVGKLLAASINCIHTGDSVSNLFDATAAPVSSGHALGRGGHATRHAPRPTRHAPHPTAAPPRAATPSLRHLIAHAARQWRLGYNWRHSKPALCDWRRRRPIGVAASTGRHTPARTPAYPLAPRPDAPVAASSLA